MTLASYLEGVVLLSLVVAPIAVAAIAVRRQLVPEWRGAIARLADLVLVMGLLTVVCELVGSVGWFRRGPLVVGAILSAGLIVYACRRWGEQASTAKPTPTVTQPRWAIAGALAVSAVVVIQWTVRVRQALPTGIVSVDSRQYHLPFAALFAQTGSLWRHFYLWIDPVWTFYPANSEMYHAVGIVAFGNDVLSPVINLGWLVIALGAAWCVGRPFGVGHLTLAATAVLVSGPSMANSQAASAKTDIALLALVLAMLAFLLHTDARLGPVVIAGVAAGLAVGTKYTALAPVAAATVAVVARASGGRRRRTAGVWSCVVLSTGGFWYLRNLAHVGNPIPEVLPGLPSPRFPAIDAYGSSVLDYAFDGYFWRDYVPDGLRMTLGLSWLPLLAVAAAGIALAVRAAIRDRGPVPRSSWLLLISTALMAGAAYVASPGSAYGPPGIPYQFGLNARYGIPAMGIALSVLVLVLPSRARPLAFAALAGTTVVNLDDASYGPSVLTTNTPLYLALGALAIAIAALGWVVLHALSRDIASRRSALALVALLVLVGSVALGRKFETSYLNHRFTSDPIGLWARDVHDARIGVVGRADQYPLFGLDVSNRVVFIGERRPHGGFRSIGDCPAFRAALASGRFDYVVAGTEKWGLEPAPEVGWLTSDPGATRLDIKDPRSPDVGVYRITTRDIEAPCDGP